MELFRGSRLGKDCERYHAVRVHFWGFEGLYGMGEVFRITGQVGASAQTNRLDFRESDAVTIDRRTA